MMAVMEQTSDPLNVRLAGVAAALDLPGLGPRVEEAVALALDLLLAERDTPATVAVASLGAGATLRDAGDDIREMLSEQGVAPPPQPPGTDTAYTTALWAVAVGGLPVGEFSVEFYRYLPAWDEQSDVQRSLVALLQKWDWESNVIARRPIEDAIRETAGAGFGGGSVER